MITVNKVINDWSGTGPDVGKMNLLQAIVEQNWIIIRQLDKLINK